METTARSKPDTIVSKVFSNEFTSGEAGLCESTKDDSWLIYESSSWFIAPVRLVLVVGRGGGTIRTEVRSAPWPSMDRKAFPELAISAVMPRSSATHVALRVLSACEMAPRTVPSAGCPGAPSPAATATKSPRAVLDPPSCKAA